MLISVYINATLSQILLQVLESFKLNVQPDLYAFQMCNGKLFYSPVTWHFYWDLSRSISELSAEGLHLQF